MARKLSEKQRAELKVRTDRCISIVEFMSELPGYASMMKDVRAAVEDASSRGNLRALRSVEADLVEWTGELSSNDRTALDARLRAALGTDLGQVKQEEETVVQEILARGRIRSDDEYRLVLRRVEDSVYDADSSESIGRLNKLLSQYDANR